MRFLGLGLLMASSLCAVGSGSYHMCTDENGSKLFTSEPCPSDQASETKKYNVEDGVVGSSRLTTDNPGYLKMKSDNRLAELK